MILDQLEHVEPERHVARIAGVVDGQVTTSFDPDGSLTFHIAVGQSMGAPDESDRIEFTVSPEHVDEVLRATATHRPGSALDTRTVSPCRVGVQLRSRR